VDVIFQHDLHAELCVPEHGDQQADQRHGIPRLGDGGHGRGVIGAGHAHHEHQEPQAQHHQGGGGQALVHEVLGAGLGRTKAAHVLQRGTELAHAAPPNNT